MVVVAVLRVRLIGGVGSAVYGKGSGRALSCGGLLLVALVGGGSAAGRSSAGAATAARHHVHVTRGTSRHSFTPHRLP
jgi:hypothetical protein